MNIFLIGVDRDKNKEKQEEIRYSNIVSLVVSFAAFIIFLVLLKSYGWIAPVYIALGVVGLINLTLVLNYFGFVLISRLYLSILPPIGLLAGDIITLAIIPDGTHPFSFAIRVLILALVVLPLLLFTMKEKRYIMIALISNGGILLFFDQIHTIFGTNLFNAFGDQYYIITIFYAIAFLFIVMTITIFKLRWCQLNTANNKLLLELEDKVLERTHELEQNSEELVKHNNELEQFSYTVSHNLRGPVARLLGLTDLYNKLDITEQSSVVSHIRSAANSLDSVISDLSKTLEIRNNLYKVNEHIDLNLEIRKAQKLLAYNGKELCCEENIILDIKQNTIFGIQAYVQSILYNLIGNAYKYRRQDVDLEIRISSEVKYPNISLKIVDNGKGIDIKKYQDKIFKMYSRFDLEKEGKGIGLYLVKQQVEAMHGVINVESEVNAGTTFSILLPIPNFSNVEHQVYYDSDVVCFKYNGILKTSSLFWKKSPSGEEFREIFEKSIEKLTMYNTDYWIDNTENFGSLSVENQKWFNERAIPAVLKSGIKGIIIINKEEKGFKSSQWNLLKTICAKQGVLLKFKTNTKEANSYISSLSNID